MSHYRAGLDEMSNLSLFFFFFERLRLMGAEMRSAFSIVQAMGSDPSLAGSSNYPMSVLEVATKNLHAHIEQASACEKLHQDFEDVVSQFHSAISLLQSERNVIFPAKCFVLNGKELKLPPFLSDMLL